MSKGLKCLTIEPNGGFLEVRCPQKHLSRNEKLVAIIIIIQKLVAIIIIIIIIINSFSCLCSELSSLLWEYK
jgi:hypothetical protein